MEWRFFFFSIELLFIRTLQLRKQLHAKWNVFSVNAVECFMKNEGNLIACAFVGKRNILRNSRNSTEQETSDF